MVERSLRKITLGEMVVQDTMVEAAGWDPLLEVFLVQERTRGPTLEVQPGQTVTSEPEGKADSTRMRQVEQVHYVQEGLEAGLLEGSVASTLQVMQVHTDAEVEAGMDTSPVMTNSLREAMAVPGGLSGGGRVPGLEATG